MKKSITLVFTFIMIGTVITACSSHKHTADAWEADLKRHWQICEECGKKLRSGKHKTDEFGYCDVCNMTVTDNGDNGYSIISYDQQGALNRQTDYDVDGDVTFEIMCESEYYEDGNPKHIKEYHDDVLMHETRYLPYVNSDIAEVYVSEEITYKEDGTKTLGIYKEQSLPLSYTSYDADGNVVTVDVYEYVYDDAGNLKKQICRTDDVISSEVIYEQNADGNSYVAHEIFYDKDGSIISENQYDAEGNAIE